MRGVMATMAEAVTERDVELLLDHGDTLLMLIQQHNVKEESMLYSMSERALGSVWPQMYSIIKQSNGSGMLRISLRGFLLRPISLRVSVRP